MSLCLALFACTEAKRTVPVRADAGSAVAPGDIEAAVRANNAFAVALFAELGQSSKGENMLSSPLSASLALSMAVAGAKGETAREMAQALHFGESSHTAPFAGQKALRQALLGRAPAALAAETASPLAQATPRPGDFQLQIVSSIWGQADYPWEARFLRTVSENHGASLTAVDFRNQFEATRRAINSWVSAQTADKIQDLLPPQAVDKTTRMVLVNALHLKLPWVRPFAPSKTDSASFTPADAKARSRRFMHSESDFRYRDDGTAQIIALPLSGEQLTVLVALPHAGISLDSYERSLRAGSAALTVPQKVALVALSLPKTSFTSETFSLSDALRALGAKRAFERNRADFSGMCSHIPDGYNLYISDVLQKTRLEVQEYGVEAAAATAVGVEVAVSLQLDPPAPIPMVVNRPFLISVVDVPTGAILMLGKINDPGDSGSP
ncbi:MAG TPA: serpin family protein [Polyangiaceae bacterium]|nr:serpin family protein [Polyangiaceae bacterium]